LINKPYKTVSFLFIITVLAYSYILRIYEMPYYRALSSSDESYRELDGFFTSVWMVIITLTTVGYGDLFPCTLPGRCVTIGVALSGSVLMALVVTIVTQSMELDPKHKIALHHMQLTRKAAVTLQYSMKYF
jgi:hypothetical protein